MVRKSTPSSGVSGQRRRASSSINNNNSSSSNNNDSGAPGVEPPEPGLVTPQQQPPALPPVTDFNASLAPPRPLCLQGALLPTPPSHLFTTPSSQPDSALRSQHLQTPPPITDKPRSTLAILNDFLENVYKLQDRAHQLWLEEQHEMKRGIALNIIYSPASDASHHSQHFTTPQQENEPPSCCVTPGAQVMHELGQDHLLFSPPSAKMDALFGVTLASTPTAGQLADHAAAQLLSPTALGLHTLMQESGSARSLPGSAHAPFHPHRPHAHSHFHPLNTAPPTSKAPPSCQEAHLGSPNLPYHTQPQSPTTQRYWQPLSGGSSAGTAPTLRCPPALGGGSTLGGLAPTLGSRSPLSRQQHPHATSAVSLASKPSRALLFHHASSSGAHAPPTQATHHHGLSVGGGIGELSPRCSFRAGFGPSSFSLRQQLLQQQLESSAVESPTAGLLPRSGKAHDPLSCPDSPADFLLSQPSSSKHPFQLSQADQQQQQLDFLGGLTHSDLRLCTTPLAKRQKR